LIGEEEHAEVGSVLLAYKYVHNPEYAPFVEEEVRVAARSEAKRLAENMAPWTDI
jgi:hypothetical protein